jgi:cytochrome c-type biogenesis protein CcmH/NrfG
MKESEEIKELLIEIRDGQQEYLTAYREVTRRSLELQQQAVMRQEQIGKLYRRVILTAAIVVIFTVIIIIYLLSTLRQSSLL